MNIAVDQSSGTVTPDKAQVRLLSLDAYRGLIMLALAFNGFGIAGTAKRQLELDPDSAWWQFWRYQFSHVEWLGCAVWDLIQPSFMFMVGVSMAYSYVKRQSRGDSWWSMFAHAALRSVVLILLGIFLISNGKEHTEWSLMNVLTQIGLGYIFLFLLWGRGYWIQLLVAACILLATWSAYVAADTGGIDLESGNEAVGVSAAWAAEHLNNVPAAWHKNANLGHQVDLRVLNWLPQSSTFQFNGGGYQTLNFVPSLATMIFGLMIGELLRSSRSSRLKLTAMVIAAATGVLLGWVCSELGCPLVKRIWTPSWALLSTGICIGILAAFYWLIDIQGWRAWSIVLVVMGANSIAVYVMYMLLRPWAAATFQTHFGKTIFEVLGAAYEPMVSSIAVGCVFWLFAYWMYRQKIFVRI